VSEHAQTLALLEGLVSQAQLELAPDELAEIDSSPSPGTRPQAPHSENNRRWPMATARGFGQETTKYSLTRSHAGSTSSTS